MSVNTLLRSVQSLAAAGLLLGAALPSAAAAAPPLADLSVDILPPAPLSAAGTIEYVVNVRNIGGLDAHNVLLDDDLPTDSMWQTVSSSVGSCGFGPFSPTVDVRCFLGTLAPGASETVRIVVHPFKVVQTTRATVSTSDPEASLANNSRTHSMTLPEVGVSDLEVRLLADRPDPVRVGGALNYVADIHNIGDDDAQDVYLVDYLPPTVQFLSAWTSAGPSCINTPTPVGEAVFCKLYTIPNAGSATATIVVRPLAPGIVYNSVALGQSTVDPTQVNNNSATARTWVNP
jgi:uncharacterized repeat protein (TIGR01451 family)